MACCISASSAPLFCISKLKSQFNAKQQPHYYSLLNNKHHISKASFFSIQNFPLFTRMPLYSEHRLRHKKLLSTGGEGEEAKPLVSEESQEVFAWSSVILPHSKRRH
ncbi:hypothetical protein FRX31_025489 [Thalictrum thalictroides]|uniref:Uncharacterized protein n=1 Tax=Thalictrum thalictroides TaxID=46969 RepID=A0A7J6VIJ5_THATH|nr:hypothetical protein FRX31_025489 [Thalictrum thalictroides]